MAQARYAIYHLPDGPLGDWGSAWLGWDARRGIAPDRPDVPDLPGDAAALTAVPRRYGFHATLKAPFRLRDGHDLDDLARRTEMICDRLTAFSLELSLHSDWGFVTLRPSRQPPELLALEQALVTRLDDLRAPLTPAEIDRRKPDQLSPSARAHLENWGYPFVLEQFTYHLTLSDALPAPQADGLALALAPRLAPLIAEPMRLRAVALLGEDATGHLRMIREFPLRG